MNSKIKEIVSRSGHVVINVYDGSKEGREQERSLAAFTIGLSHTVMGPELVFVDEDSETISKFIDRYKFYRGVGISIEELIKFTKLGDSAAKFEVVKEDSARKIIPTMFNYFEEEYPGLELPQVIWVGRTDSEMSLDILE